MAFDDCKTEPLIAAGCLAVLCGFLAPVAVRWFGWWSVLLVVPPTAAWALLGWVWRRGDRGG
jgi:hypothetical protein